MIQVQENSSILIPAKTVEQAIVDLAGAIQVAIEFQLRDHGNKELDLPWYIIYSAFKQWRDTGFFIKEADELTEFMCKEFLIAENKYDRQT